MLKLKVEVGCEWYASNAHVNIYLPELQEISVCLQADAGVEEGNADDGGDAVVAPPYQEPGVRGAGVGGLHQGIDALVSEHHQNGQAGHLNVTLQTKQKIESTDI